jgi:predicted MFS family arabinose efflux permease
MTDIAELPVAKSESPSAERILRVSSAATFALFFQTYMIAPLIPFLSESLHTSRQKVGLLIPAYTLPYAASALLCGTVSDRFGRKRILLLSVGAFVALSFLMAAAPSINALLLLRMVSGALNFGIAVVSLSMVGDLFAENQRGRPIGWIFGAIAGGSAFGSTLGAMLAPVIGWRGLFLLTGVSGGVILAMMFSLHRAIPGRSAARPTNEPLWHQYQMLLSSGRARRTYTFIFLNAVFHSGVFTWIGALLHDRYQLGEIGIGIVLLGYGVPGFILGPYIGSLADRYGRSRIIPAGFAVAALSAAMLIPTAPMLIAALALTVLSLGFDMSHPLMAGISTMLDPKRRGLAMGFNAFAIFGGFGIGSLAFGALSARSFPLALGVFAAIQLLLSLTALPAFASEVPQHT